MLLWGQQYTALPRSTISNSLALEVNSTKFIAQITPSTSTSETAPKFRTYEDYVRAGRQAEKQGDYQTAIEYFEKALILRPQSSQIISAIRNATNAAFDAYMQAGYLADRQRDYSKALENFQAALALKPNSFYAQQAINNVTQYLVAARERSFSNTSDRLWFFLAIVVTATVGAILLWMLFRLRQSSEEADSETELLESITSELENNSPPELAAVDTKAKRQFRQLQSAHSIETSESLAEDISPVDKNNRALKPLPVSTSRMDDTISEPTDEKQQSILTSRDRQPQNVSTGTDSVGKVTIVTSKTTNIDIVYELIKDLKQDDSEIRRKAIWQLAQKSDSRGIKPLVEILPEVDSLEKSLILDAITQIASRTLKPLNKVLILSLENENSQVRKNAIRDLTIIYESMSQVSKRLSEMIRDSDTDVQQTAKWALQQLQQMPKLKNPRFDSIANDRDNLTR